MPPKKIGFELSLNTILQLATIIGFIVSGTVFVMRIEYRVKSLETDNRSMHTYMKEFIKDEQARDARQDAALVRFADKIDKRLDAIEARSAYCPIAQKG